MGINLKLKTEITKRHQQKLKQDNYPSEHLPQSLRHVLTSLVSSMGGHNAQMKN